MIPVLFAHRKSIYKSFAHADCWDMERNALLWPGGSPCVAHPPCRAWGQLRQFAKPRLGEKELAIWAIDQINKYGGVLEHPSGSSLWPHLSLPRPDDHSLAYRGFFNKVPRWTLAVEQSWWGHKASKATWLYIIGCAPHEIPALPAQEDRPAPTHVIDSSHAFKKLAAGSIKHLPKSQREHTPIAFAAWLLELAKRCKV
jgi:hypothetical protein